jgi:hypothetical protein
LAAHLAAAYLVYMMAIDFPEAMRYVQRHRRAGGDLWTAGARFIFGAISLIDRVRGAMTQDLQTIP